MKKLINSCTAFIMFLPLPLVAEEVAVAVPTVPNVMGAGNILQIVAGLFVVLAIIIGAGWLLKRYGGIGGMANENLKVVAGISVGQREKIVVIQAGDTQVLVGIAPGNIRALHVLAENIDDESLLNMGASVEKNNNDRFINQLKQQVEKRENL